MGFVQVFKQTWNSGNNPTVTLSGVTVGNLLIAVAAIDASNSAADLPTGVVDDSAQVFGLDLTQNGQIAASGHATGCHNIFHGFAQTTSPVITFQWTPSHASSGILLVFEYSGFFAKDGSSTNSGTGSQSSPVSSGNATTANANDLIFGFAKMQVNAGNSTGAGSGFTRRMGGPADTNFTLFIGEDETSGVAGTYAASFVVTGAGSPAISDGYTASVVAYSPASPVDFTISASPAIRTIHPIDSTTYTITIAGGNEDVTLSVLSGLPSGATAVFSQTIVAGGSGTSTLTITANNVAYGTSTVTIKAVAPHFNHTVTVTLQCLGSFSPRWVSH